MLKPETTIWTTCPRCGRPRWATTPSPDTNIRMLWRHIIITADRTHSTYGCRWPKP